MRTRASQFLSLVVLTSFLVVGLACSKAPSDAELAGSVQSRFSQDSGLASKTLNVQAANGRVTLSGSVDNEMQRDAAARQAAAVPGVKDVVNNLQVMPSNTEATSQAPAPVEEKPTPAAAPVTRPRPSKGLCRPMRARAARCRAMAWSLPCAKMLSSASMQAGCRTGGSRSGNTLTCGR